MFNIIQNKTFQDNKASLFPIIFVYFLSKSNNKCSHHFEKAFLLSSLKSFYLKHFPTKPFQDKKEIRNKTRIETFPSKNNNLSQNIYAFNKNLSIEKALTTKAFLRRYKMVLTLNNYNYYEKEKCFKALEQLNFISKSQETIP